MGNYRLRLSTFIPNSWLYTSITGNKVKNKLTKTQPITTSSSSSSSFSSFSASKPATDQRKSYYFTRDLIVPEPITLNQDPSPVKIDHQPDPRRKSSKKKRPTTPKKPIGQKSLSPELNPAGKCSCRSPVESNFSDTEQTLSCSNEDVYAKVDLPPIITKPAKRDKFGSGKWVVTGGRRSLSVKVVSDGVTRSPARKLKGNSHSPRLGNRVRINGINAGGRRRSGDRRSLSESMVVVKTTVDPGRDFKESMVEMIMGNNIRSSRDLEDLLACYLSLNSDEYHDLIIKVFKQIWFESSDVRL